MNKRIVLAVVVILALTSAVFFGTQSCRNPPQKARQVHIAANIPLSGPMATFSGQIPNGFRMGLQDAAKEAGLDPNIFVTDFQDNESNPALGTTIAQRQVANGFDIYMSAPSAVATNLVPIISPTGKPHFVVAFDPELLKGDPNKFRLIPNLKIEAPLYVKYAKSQHAKRVFMMHSNFAAYHEEYSKLIEPGLREAGIEFVREVFEFNSSDFRTIAQKAAQYKPDLIFVTSFGVDLQRALQALREANVSKPGNVMCTMDFVDLLHAPSLAPGAAGSVFAAPLFEIPGAIPAADPWRQRYQEQFHRSPSYVEAYAYETARAIVAAYKSGGVDSASIRRLFPRQGIVGDIVLDESGDLSSSVVVGRVDELGHVSAVDLK